MGTIPGPGQAATKKLDFPGRGRRRWRRPHRKQSREKVRCVRASSAVESCPTTLLQERVVLRNHLRQSLLPVAFLGIVIAACTDVSGPASGLYPLKPSPALNALTSGSLPVDSLAETTTTSDDCNPYTAVEPCDEPDGGGGGPFYQWNNTYFGVADSSLHDVPGDPYSGSPGVYLGEEAGPRACYIGTDSDLDDMNDHCEITLARAFAPLLHFDPDEICAGGEPYWAAKLFLVGSTYYARLAYLPAYYDDCGYHDLHPPYGYESRDDAHQGDSEMITVQVRFDVPTKHWVFDRSWTSAHYKNGNPFNIGDESKWNSVSESEFSVRYRAFPNIYVARDKHANYPSEYYCDGGFNYNDMEECSNGGRKVRFPVLENRNVGSPSAPLACQESQLLSRQGEYYRAECFFDVNGPSSFRGWYELQMGETDPPSYYFMLTDENHFEYW